MFCSLSHLHAPIIFEHWERGTNFLTLGCSAMRVPNRTVAGFLLHSFHAYRSIGFVAYVAKLTVACVLVCPLMPVFVWIPRPLLRDFPQASNSLFLHFSFPAPRIDTSEFAIVYRNWIPGPRCREAAGTICMRRLPARGLPAATPPPYPLVRRHNLWRVHRRWANSRRELCALPLSSRRACFVRAADTVRDHAMRGAEAHTSCDSEPGGGRAGMSVTPGD